jgi:hypothetical protein
MQLTVTEVMVGCGGGGAGVGVGELLAQPATSRASSIGRYFRGAGWWVRLWVRSGLGLSMPPGWYSHRESSEMKLKSRKCCRFTTSVKFECARRRSGLNRGFTSFVSGGGMISE